MPLARYKNLASEKKDSILRSAAREFSEHGFEQASLNRLLTDAGLSKGAFYYYFEDKADLFITVVRAKLPLEQWLHESQLLRSESPDAFWDALAALESRKYNYLGSYPKVVRLTDVLSNLNSSHCTNSAFASYREERRVEHTRVFEHGRQIDAIRSDLPPPLVLNLWLGTTRSLSEWILEDWQALSQIERDERSQIAIRTIRDVLERRDSCSATLTA